MLLFLLINFISLCSAFNPYPKSETKTFEGDGGFQMFFSKYIDEDNIQNARKLSLVTSLTPNVTSYAGFITVNQTCDSNLFIWFFPSQNDPSTDPVTIWLEGGPGATSFFGSLAELGPYHIDLNGDLILQEFTWNRNSSLLFVDSPVGTGYSFTNSLSCYATNQVQVATDLVNALQQFFQVFPEYKKNDFYVGGPSYAGKYVPALGYAIHTSDTGINLKGLIIADGWTDPINQLEYSKYTYQIGLVDARTRDEMAKHEQLARDYIADGLFEEATDEWNYLLGGILLRSTGYSLLYNFLYPFGAPEGPIIKWVTSEEARNALHVGNATWHGDGLVYNQLYADISQSVRPWLETLLDNYKVLIYNGQVDIIVAYPLTLEYLKKLQWSGSEDYLVAERKIWRVGGDIAGYSKTVGNFTEVLVRNAGHIVPEDQPEWAADLFYRFIFGLPVGD